MLLMQEEINKFHIKIITKCMHQNAYIIQKLGTNKYYFDKLSYAV